MDEYTHVNKVIKYSKKLTKDKDDEKKDDDSVKKQVFKLYKHQKTHVRDLLKIYERSHCAIDMSPTGLGKTYSSVQISKDLRLPIFVVCPASAKEIVWNEIVKTYDIPVVDILSYESLRNMKNNEYITMKPDAAERQKFENVYTTTKKLKNIAMRGALFIFDEAHKLKNRTKQNFTISALTNTVSGFKQSKILFLSATIFDKPAHAMNIFKALGYEISPNKKRTHDTLIDELIRLRVPGEKILLYYNSANFLSNFLSLIPEISSTMVFKIKKEMNVENVFLKLKKSEREEFEDLVWQLEYEINLDRMDLGSITQQLMQIQLIKSKGTADLAKQLLKEDPKCKVIIFADYYIAFDNIFRFLKRQNPLFLASKLKMEERANVIKEFQADNNNHRLLVTSPSISGVGISLHDIHGGRKRYALMMPNYVATNIQQTFGRIFRLGIKTDAQIYMMYGDASNKKTKKKLHYEFSVMKNLYEKSGFLKNINSSQVDSGIKFACDV